LVNSIFYCVGQNLSSFGFSLIGFLGVQKPNVLKCAVGFRLVANGEYMRRWAF